MNDKLFSLNTPSNLDSLEHSPQEEVFVFPASFAQQRLWFLDQLVPGNPFYNVPTAIRLTGSLNLVALEATFNEIVRRHEALRTTFRIMEGQPIQVIAPSLSVPVPVVDLRALPTAERETKARHLVTEEQARPFDLSQGPLLRVKLLQLDETEYVLLINMHHIVSDDWSIGVLIRELGAHYTAYNSQKTSPLPPLPLQYADFAHWQHEWLQGDTLTNQLTYWQQQLNHIPVLDLPTDRTRKPVQSYRGATQFFELPKSLSENLESLSQREEATLFMTLLCAFQVLLYHYTGQEDIPVGSPIANRNRSETESLIGFFVNTLVLRSDLSGNPTFVELLHRVKEVALGAYAHQDLPFEKLAQELHLERDLSVNSLFQVIFALQNAPMGTLELPGLRISAQQFDIETTRFDLELHLWKSSEGFRSLWGENWEHSQGLRGVVVYSSDLFDQATIARMVRHFHILLEGIVDNPQTRIADLPLLTVAERQQLLIEWNDTARDYPQNLCIHQVFEAIVEETPDAVAAVFGDKRITYGELNERSNKVARYLHKLGVSSEVLVGICMERSLDMIVGMLGILKAGGAYVPLDHSYPDERLSLMIEDAGISVLLTHSSSVLTTLGNFVVVCLDRDWELIAQEGEKNLESNAVADNLAYVIYTSGSTGKPKGVAVPHKAVTRLVLNTNYIQLEPSDKIAQVSNSSFDAATFEIWGALLNGAQLIWISREIAIFPQEFVVEIRNQEINILFLTTALFNQVAREVPNAFHSLKCLLFGGEAVDARWVREVIQNQPPKQLIHVYGPTEGTTFSSYYSVHDVPEEATSIPIGRPIANTQIYILNKQLQPVPIGVTGELYIGGDGLAQGYFNHPELTDEKFIYNPFNPVGRLYKTGDLARNLPDGNIVFLGRIDEQVKIRGYRIELGEIEAVLSQHPAVGEAVVIIREDLPGDKRLVAYILLKQEQTNPVIDLRYFLKQKLPDYMVPSAFVILENLPLTPNGKVNRRALPTPNIINTELSKTYVAPQTPIEKVLAEIWAEVLGLKQVSVQDNFFELGGHSLLATQLISRVRDAFQVELPLRSLFEAPTVENFANYIETICWATKTIHTPSCTQNREEVEF
ncbi:MAG: amino acid adenylation domain-containing protein [Potamolinea sp.]